MTVRQFLLTKYKTGTGEPLFRFCYLVKYAMREFVVKTEHAKEAIEFFKIAKEDMLAYMSNDAPGMIFENIQEIKDRAADHVNKWEPYTMANEYDAIMLEQEEKSKPNHKRNKTEHGNNGNDNNRKGNARQSYSEATKNNANNNNKYDTQQNAECNISYRTEHDKNMANEILLLKEQIAIIKSKKNKTNI